MPLLILAAPAMILLHLSSLVKRFFTGFYAVYTIVVALVAAGFAVGLWWRVTSDDAGRGPFSTLHGVYGVDGFSVFVTIVLCASVVLDRAVRRRLPAAGAASRAPSCTRSSCCRPRAA